MKFWQSDEFTKKNSNNQYIWQDYTEAIAKSNAVYFGSLKYPPLSNYREDVINGLREKSDYYARVLCPERTNRTDNSKWSYEKNAAFWAGIIDKQRPLKLLTDINFYKAPTTGTVDEIFWLHDNGYIFVPDPVNKEHTWVVPSETPSQNPKLYKYENGNGEDVNFKSLESKLKHIKLEINNQRENYTSNVNLNLIIKNANYLKNIGLKTQPPDEEILLTSLETFKLASRFEKNSNNKGNILSKQIEIYQIIKDKKYAQQIINIGKELKELGFKTSDHDRNILQFALNAFTLSFSLEEKLEKKMNILKEQLEIYETLNDLELINEVSKNINALGKKYDQLKQYKNAFECYMQAANTTNKIKNFKGEITYRLNAMIAKYKFANEEEKISIANTTYVFFNTYCLNSHDFEFSNKNFQIAKILGDHLKMVKDYQNAFCCYQTAKEISIFNKNNDSKVYFNLGVCSICLANEIEAIKYLKQAIEIGKNNITNIKVLNINDEEKTKILIENPISKYYVKLAEIYEKNNSKDALDTYKQLEEYCTTNDLDYDKIIVTDKLTKLKNILFSKQDSTIFMIQQMSDIAPKTVLDHESLKKGKRDREETDEESINENKNPKKTKDKIPEENNDSPKNNYQEENLGSKNFKI